MTLYYCINDILDKVEAAKDQDNRFHIMVPVEESLPDCGGHTEDVFHLSSNPKLLDLRRVEAVDILALLIEQIPLYSINMELILDLALSERHHNSHVEHALNVAFEKRPLPNTLKAGNPEEEDLSGGLRHPMLGHLNKKELCKLYISFLHALERGQEQYGFERNILGKNVKRFLEHFDGFASNADSKVKAGILLAFGSRQDHEREGNVDNYLSKGEKEAKRMRIEEPHELIWAWIEAESYQVRRCRDIHRIMSLPDLPKTPNWMKADIFKCLEKEAMKQHFAKTLAAHHNGMALVKDAAHLKRALELNAEKQVSESMQQLLAEILGQNRGYAGSAGRFVENAEKRLKDAKRYGLYAA